MRLLSLTIRNFRGFGTSVDQITLDADLVLFYGPNGHSKTSLAEAVEWLFYGCTKRRLLGEQSSTTEYAGTYANVHGRQPVEVSSRIRLPEGRCVELIRRMDPALGPEASRTFIDGRDAGFESLGIIPNEAVYPVVAQHSLQTFIHSKPKDRRDAIANALGLDELTARKTAIDGARKSFQSSPPLAVSEARNRLRPLTRDLATLPETVNLAQRWQRTPMEVSHAQDLQDHTAAAQALSGDNTTVIAELIQSLRAKRQIVSQSVFDTAKVTLPPGSENVPARLEIQFGELSELF
jgi:chromosome segregation ATPase